MAECRKSAATRIPAPFRCCSSIHLLVYFMGIGSVNLFKVPSPASWPRTAQQSTRVLNAISVRYFTSLIYAYSYLYCTHNFCKMRPQFCFKFLRSLFYYKSVNLCVNIYNYILYKPYNKSEYCIFSRFDVGANALFWSYQSFNYG